MHNRVSLIGNIGSDPEAISIKNDTTTLTKFSLATTDYFNGQTHTQWHNVACFGQSATFASQYCYKGSTVFVEGSIRYSEYEKEVGDQKVKLTSSSIYATTIKLLKKPNRTGLEQPKKDSDKDSSANIPF